MAGENSTLDQRTFKKLSRQYLLALSAIALSIIISQILIHKFLDTQKNDSRIINIAGRQRMLSQKLTKEVLLLATELDPVQRLGIKDDLEETVNLFTASQEALRNGNDSFSIPGNFSKKVEEKFQQISPSYNKLLEISENIIGRVEVDPLDFNTYLIGELQALKEAEGEFVVLMDHLVKQYEVEASSKISRLRNLERWLMTIALLILVTEFFLIFWPTAKTIRRILRDLLDAEKNAVKMAKNADLLSESKENSVRELRGLSQALDKTILFARITPDGFLIHMGDKFSQLFKFSDFNMHSKFSEVLSTLENEQTIIEQIIEEHRKSGWQGEIKTTHQDGRDIWLDMSIIPYNTGEDKTELLIICIDITKRKQVQLEIKKLTTDSFEEKMLNQKTIFRKIIENQEKEQNRIAKDIHDGIGQMLTGLKYTLESVELSNPEKAAAKIENLKNLTSNIIQGVRTATFNLTPPELTDHGITPALIKLTKELAGLTAKNIVLFNKTDFQQRLDSLVEINIYRITQEAINNAIKYADSTHIIVTISHSKDLLSITIDDNGKGFSPEKIKSKKEGNGGMGLTFMKERIKYINGRIFINSNPGEGTRVTINIPIK